MARRRRTGGAGPDGRRLGNTSGCPILLGSRSCVLVAIADGNHYANTDDDGARQCPLKAENTAAGNMPD